MNLTDYSAVFNQATLNAFYQSLPPEEKADFQANFTTLNEFIRSANKGLIELLECYLLDRDGEGKAPDTNILINAIYTLRNNAQIENQVADFVAYQVYQEQQEQAKTPPRTPYTATNENGH